MRNEIQKMESNVSLRDHMICYLYQSGDPCLVQQAKQLAVQSSKSHVLHIMKANFSCFVPEHKPANKKSSVFLKKISKIRFDILCITFKPPEMPALKVVI